MKHTKIILLVVVLLAATLIAESARAQGRRFRGGRGAVDAPGLAGFVTRDFAGSGHCILCHDGLVDVAGHDVSIARTWRSAMLANSARDPLWQAKVRSETVRTPELAAAIEEKCARCHMPMARTQAAADGGPVRILDHGFLDPSHPLSDAALDGVSCSLCHQICRGNLGEPQSFTGGYVVHTGASVPERPMFGPFDEPFIGPMRNHVGYTPTPGSQVADAALCGTCHMLYTPIVGATPDGATGEGREFPEQTTWLEWKHSRYAGEGGAVQICQDCHMPVACGPASVSNRPPWLDARAPFALHRFVGANVFLLEILRRHGAELGATAAPSHFEATLERTRRQLREATASLAIRELALAADRLTAVLEVRNLAGHKLPSGIPCRRVWLHVTVTDATGEIVLESGRPDSEGRIAGNDADRHAGAFEPHHERIASPNDVQIYEPILADTEGRVTYTLLHAATYLKDNRLLPEGFDAAAAHPDVAVRGAASRDPDFGGGADRVSYEADVSGRPGPFLVTAELLFQPVSWRFLEDLRRDAASPLVTRFLRLADGADRTPETMARVSSEPIHR